MRPTLVLLAATMLVSGCALRPRYADFVTAKTAGKDVTLLVTDLSTNQPVANARIEVSELRNRLSATSGADGTFKLPVDKKYLEENPVFVVNLPRGVEAYRLSLAPAPLTPDVGLDAPPQGPPPPSLSPSDAGLPVSNG